ncbi:MAG: phage tail assembly protein [Acidobacteriia bacterium]|nr:phage tail assembly protein [Terriglobia bacterium]MYG20943.1 phage tail assembly protein [Gemmatimonadota bacterium]MYK08835.1 phage tail assembly protein [Terriglobia bacterium]
MTKYEDLPRDGKGGLVAESIEFPVEIPLLRPVEVGGRKLESVSLREPTALDIEMCWKHPGEITRMVNLLASLAELAPDEVRALKAADFARAAEAAGAFL